MSVEVKIDKGFFHERNFKSFNCASDTILYQKLGYLIKVESFFSVLNIKLNSFY